MGATRPRILVLEREPELAERVRRAAAALEPVPEVVLVPGLAGATQAVVNERPDVIVAGPSLLTGAGLYHLETLHQKVPSTAIVLVIAGRPLAGLLEIVRVGADDALPADVDEEELALTLERVVALARRRGGAPAPVEATSSRGRVVTVASPTEGCGKTFLAANTALFLSRRTGGRVILVDLDLQFGEVRTALRLKTDLSIIDGLRAEADGMVLERVLPDLLVRHDAGFSILAAPRNPVDADSVGAGGVARVLEALRAHADWVVIDTPTGLADHALPAFEVTDDLLMVATADRPSVHNAGVFLNALGRLGLAADVALVLNKAEADDLSEAAAQLPVRALLPYDRAVTRSINVGVPLLEGTPDSPAARGLIPLLERLLEVPDQRPVPSSAEPAADPPQTTEPSPNAPPAPDRRRVASDSPWPRHAPRCRPPAGRPATRPGRHHPALRRGLRVRAPPDPG